MGYKGRDIHKVFRVSGFIGVRFRGYTNVCVDRMNDGVTNSGLV